MSFGCSSYSPVQFRGCLTNASFRTHHGIRAVAGSPPGPTVGLTRYCRGRGRTGALYWARGPRCMRYALVLAVFWILRWTLVFWPRPLCASSGVCGCMSTCVCRGTFRPRRRWTCEQEVCFCFHRHSEQLAELTDRGTVKKGLLLRLNL